MVTPEAWLASGEQLLADAQTLAAPVATWWDKWGEYVHGRGPEPLGDGGHRTMLMLLGFAAENFLKARLVDELSEQEIKRARSESKLPKRLSTHGLESLAKAAGFSLPERDIYWLAKLERAAVWMARYPVPLCHNQSLPSRFQDGRGNYSMGGTADGEQTECLALVERVREHVMKTTRKTAPDGKPEAPAPHREIR
jgi:hypothetical protein